MKKIQPLALAAALLPAAAHAQGTWNGTTNNDWGTATNWNPASVPAIGADIVIADTTGSSNQLVLDADRSIGNLQFGTTGTRTAGFSLRSTSAHTLDLAGGLTATGAFTGVGLTMNGNFSISANQEWNIGGDIGAHNTDRGVFIREVVEANGTTPAGATGIGSLVLDANLTKTGSGQLVLAATSVSGAGNFIVNEGALKINAGVSHLVTLGGGGNVTLNNDAQLFLSKNSGTMSVTRDIILNDTAGMVWGGGGSTAPVTVDSDIAWNGTHALNLPQTAHAYTSTGAWTGGGTINRSGTATLTLTGDLSGFTGALNLQAGITNLSGAGTFNGNLSGSGTIRKIDEGTLDFAGSSTHTGFFDINGGTVRIVGGNNRLGVGSQVILHNTLEASLDLNGFNQEIRILGGGSAASSVTNSGAGTSVLTIRPAVSDNRSFDGVISGDVRLEIVGSKSAPDFTTPRQRLSNTSNSFTGGILVDGATLMATRDSVLGAVPAAFDPSNIILQNNGTLLNNFSGVSLVIDANRGITLGTGGGALLGGFGVTTTVNSVISGEAGNGLTILANDGAVVFNGNNTYAGTTTLQAPIGSAASRLRIGDGGSSGSLGTGDVINNGQLSFNRSDAYTYAGEISGTGSVTQLGGGTTILAGNNTYSGATLVSAGTLLVTGELGATAVSVDALAAFGGTGILEGDLDFAGTAILHVVDTSDALRVTGNVTFGSDFGIANLSGVDWDAVALDSPFTILSTTQTFSSSDIANFGLGNAVAVGSADRLAYFQNGSLQVVVIPEPGVSLLGGLAALLILRRRR